MLQALPHTALSHRLAKEGRLRDKSGNLNQTTLMNFIPTRPLEDIAREYVQAFSDVYDAEKYLDRTYRHFLMLGAPTADIPSRIPSLIDLRALLTVVWRQGVKRSTRWKFWHHLFSIIRRNPAVWDHYLTVCAHNEHFLEYRQIVRDEIEEQLAEFLADEAQQAQQKALIASIAEKQVQAV